VPGRPSVRIPSGRMRDFMYLGFRWIVFFRPDAFSPRFRLVPTPFPHYAWSDSFSHSPSVPSCLRVGEKFFFPVFFRGFFCDTFEASSPDPGCGSPPELQMFFSYPIPGFFLGGFHIPFSLFRVLPCAFLAVARLRCLGCGSLILRWWFLPARVLWIRVRRSF